jgi:autotransporter-associated beta strand protein
VTITVLATSPSETLTAYAALAGHPSSATNSATYTLNAGIWTNTVGGNWSAPASWLFALVPNSSGITADFSTLTLSHDTTVTNDVGPTVGSMVFADRGSAHNWIVADIGAGPIELDNGANPPVITVSNQTATINTVLDNNASGSGLTKAGNGTLALSGTNTYTGTTEVTAGTLSLLASMDTYLDSPLVIDAGAVVASSATLNLNVNQNGNNPSVNVSGAGVLRLTSTNNNASSPDLFFGPDHVSNDYWGAREAAPLDLGSQQRFIYGLTGHNGVGQYGVNNADCMFGGSITGSGGMTIIAQNSWTGGSPMEVGFCLDASNSFTGPLEIQRGSVYQGAASGFPSGDVLRFNVAAENNGKFFLYGYNTSVSDLSSTNAGGAWIANGNANPSAYGPVTLTVTQNNSATFAGTIADANAEYGVTAGSQNTILSLWKTGPATLTLVGANIYSGTTTVSGGTLLVNGSIGAGTVTVATGGTLGGTGTLGGATTVQSGGTFAPGNNGLGTLTISNTLTLAADSSTTLAINRSAGTASYGNVAGLTSASFGGTLTVTSLGGTFQPSDSFQLFSLGSGSNFSAINLPAISPLEWNWNPATGTLSVVSGGSVNTTPTNITARVTSGILSLSWPSDHLGWRLVVQTNSLAAGISFNPNDWATVAASSSTNQVVIPIDKTKPAAFYRLVYP